MTSASFTSSALDRAVHPLDLRGVLNVMSALAADGRFDEAAMMAAQATCTSGPVQSDELYWMIFGAQRLLFSLQQGRQRRSRRRRHNVSTTPAVAEDDPRPPLQIPRVDRQPAPVSSPFTL